MERETMKMIKGKKLRKERKLDTPKMAISMCQLDIKSGVIPNSERELNAVLWHTVTVNNHVLECHVSNDDDKHCDCMCY